MRLASLFVTIFTALFVWPFTVSAQGLIRDAEIESVVREWSDPIFTAAGLQARDVNIYLLNDPTINAFVTRGQNMFLHTGTIVQARTPNEIKGVIAHETGHMADGHLARSSDAMNKAMRPVILTMGLGLLAALAGAPDAGAAILGSAGQFGTVTFFAHSRVQEAAADQAAVRYMDATHQSGEGLLRFFQQFRTAEVIGGAKRYPYFLNHPLSSERISSLKSQVEASPWRDVKDSPEDVHKLAMIKAKIVGFLNKPEQVKNLYPEEDQSEPARYARAISNYLQASTSIALTQIGDLLKEEPDNPYFNELYGQVLFESGKAEEAVRYHQHAVDNAPTSPLLRLNLAQAMIATDRPEAVEQAILELKQVIAREMDNSFAWYELSVAYEKQGNTPMAKLATAEQAYALGDYGRARSFAQRAQHDLKFGTPEWRRANDIVLVIAADPKIRKRLAQRRPQ